MATSRIEDLPEYTLLRGCALLNDRRTPSHYLVGTTERVVAVTSAFERSALIQMSEGVNPLTQVHAHLRDELAQFLKKLAEHGFLNRKPAQLRTPKRFFEEIDRNDLAAKDFQLRTNPELAQSEWIDSASDGGASTVAARSLHPILLSGR